jgi:hypothetical protein
MQQCASPSIPKPCVPEHNSGRHLADRDSRDREEAGKAPHLPSGYSSRIEFPNHNPSSRAHGSRQLGGSPKLLRNLTAEIHRLQNIPHAQHRKKLEKCLA